MIHIGTHKTGTSSIQSFLHSAAVELRTHGVVYPATDREPWPTLPKHCSVFAAAMRGDMQQATSEREWLVQQAADAEIHTVLVSEEGLSEPHPQLVEFFRPLVARFEIHVVCFLRRPDYFVESLYNQFVREPARREVRPVSLFVRAKPVRERLQYATILDRWKSLPAQVTAVDFDLAARRGDLLATFAAACGLPLSPSSTDRTNSSPDMRLIQVLGRLNRQRIPYDLHKMMQAATMLEHEQRFEKLKYVLGKRERLNLLEDLAPELSALKRDYGIEFSGELPNEPMSSHEDVDIAYLAELSARLSRERTE